MELETNLLSFKIARSVKRPFYRTRNLTYSFILANTKIHIFAVWESKYVFDWKQMQNK